LELGNWYFVAWAVDYATQRFKIYVYDFIENTLYSLENTFETSITGVTCNARAVYGCSLDECDGNIQRGAEGYISKYEDFLHVINYLGVYCSSTM